MSIPEDVLYSNQLTGMLRRLNTHVLGTLYEWFYSSLINGFEV